jgi:hypothetical protein
VEGTAEVVTGAEFERVLAAITAEYGWQLRLILLFGKVRSLFGSSMQTDTGVVVTLVDT